MQLMLFTSSYPYNFSAEYTFIHPEIGFLAKKFSDITLFPRTSKGQKLALPSNVKVDEDYSEFLKKGQRPGKIIRAALSSTLVKEELRSRADIWFYPAKILKLIMFASRVELIREWVTRRIRNRQIDPQQCLLYSYWMDHSATGLIMAKRDFPSLRVVSRAHGYDIFEEYYYPYYWPYRVETLSGLDAVYSASDAGKKYFRERYPTFFSKFKTAHLGVNEPNFICMPSADGVFRIVTCSYIVSVKRLKLLMKGIAAAARYRPNQKIEWTHFGDGSGRASLQRHMRRELPHNVTACLMGHVPNKVVMEFYRDNPVDVFINVSKTEGGAPVSIQEAISCGIPVIATDVGGNPEIVSETNGVLTSPDPSPEEIADAIFQFIDNPSMSAAKRKGSYDVWRRKFNADENFRKFAEQLRSIGES